MANVRTKITRQNPGAGRKVSLNYEKALKNGVRMAGMMVRATAVQSITSGPKTGRRYGAHIASAPGEAPAADTGFLHNNIFFVLDADGYGASVESRAAYSSFLELEFGSSKMAARPFLQPALEENRPKIRRLMENLAKGAN